MNDAVNMAAHVAPKSDQLNADDLISGPRTITITRVRANGGNPDQPVAIHFDGDNNKPYLACKSMRRVMVHVWGADTKIYVGRSMTLYCDPEVQFGGMKVGGIRISHMSHIDEPKSMPLTTTRARRALFTVQPLQRAANEPKAAAPEAKPAADPEARALASLEAAFKSGREELVGAFARIENYYATRNQPIPLAVDAKYGELTEALKE